MSTIQPPEAKFDGLEQRLIRLVADMASLISFMERERAERLEFQNRVINVLETLLESVRHIDGRLDSMDGRLARLEEREQG